MSKTIRPGLVIAATLLGNTLEWFEYLSFAFLTPIFAKIFFPQLNGWSSIAHTMMGFIFGYLLRPIGGLLFGYLGDRHGRKWALLASIAFMSFPTLVIGLQPTYAQIGTASIVILLSMRLLQGLATGGEFPSSMTFLVESAPAHSRSLYGSFVYTGMTFGILLGSLDYFIVHHYFEGSLYIWGWRTIYLVGAVLGMLAFILRSKLHETYPFQELKECHEVLKDPLITLFQKYKSQIIEIFGLQVLQTISFNVFISFSVVYFTEVLQTSYSKAAQLTLFFLLILLLAVPLAGFLGNRLGAKPMMVWAAWGHFLFALPIYWLLQTEYRLFALAGGALLLSFYMAPSISLICSLFPAKVRLSGVSLGYNLPVSFIGPFSPLAALSLIHWTNVPIAPAFLIMAAALISLIFLRRVNHT